MYEIEYESDLVKSYVVVRLVESSEMEDYQIQMISRNDIKTLLTLNKRIHNDRYCIYYDITSKQKLSDVLERKRLNSKNIKNILNGLVNILNEYELYYLDCNKILLDKDYIYIDPEDFKPKFLYVPVKNLEIDFTEQAKTLIEYIFQKVDKSDIEAIKLIHDLLYKIKSNNFNLSNLENVLSQNSVEKTISSKEPVVEKVIPLINNNFDTQNGNGHKKVHTYNDSEEDNEKLKNRFLSKKYLIIFIQVCLLILFYSISKTNIFISDITGKLKIESMVALLLILCIMDYLLIIKLIPYIDKVINPKNSTKNNSNRLQEEEEIHRNLKVVNEIKHKSVNYLKPTHTQLSISDRTQLLTDYNNNLEKGAAAYLIKIGDKNKIKIDNNPFIIGKLEDQVDFVLENPAISRIHSKIIIEDNKYYLIDLNSKNGTFLKESRIISNKKYVLENNDTIIFSNCEYQFKLVMEEESGEKEIS